MMTPAYPQRVAIVTGGSRGIGRTCAERLVTDDMTVVIAYLGNDTVANVTVNQERGVRWTSTGCAGGYRR